ncbi:hypothetical protein KDK_30160 [Dictyobacter kobayashii]|uniref:Uncharacterized protein n=1 Tax=Dictyobacter kobayashii TaxID=2014872 RepID=A0A402AJE2_9CHLR|nr:hypothetical protein KDK_30160 [Dictyobacter kobayashii]
MITKCDTNFDIYTISLIRLFIDGNNIDTCISTRAVNTLISIKNNAAKSQLHA